MNGPVKRLTRTEQQQQTRQALLDAAIRLFCERGIDATSIEEVSGYAGFTRGAFYSNFTDKDDLVVEAARRFLQVLHAAARPPEGATLGDAGVAYKERMERLRPVAEGNAAVFLAELALYAIRHPDVHGAIAELQQAQRKPAIEFVRAQLEQAGVKKPAGVSYEVLANIMQALTFGLELMSQVHAPVPPEQSLAIATRALVNGLR